MSRRRLQAFQHGAPLTDVAASTGGPDDRAAVATSGLDGCVIVWDLHHGDPIAVHRAHRAGEAYAEVSSMGVYDPTKSRADNAASVANHLSKLGM